jgi:ABC-2 type transport system permease protein
MKYFRIWYRLALNSYGVQASSPLSSFGYLLGKLMRLAFFLIFLSAIFKHTTALAGYSLEEAALFFLTFNLADILAQLFFRGIYGIRGMIREGDFDYFLIQPVNVLYRVSFNMVDFLDVLTVIPVFAILYYVLRHIPGGLAQHHLGLYIFLTLNGLLIAFAIHIAVACFAVLTQEMENTIWIYRDLMTLGRFPSDIYDAPMRGILTYLIPIAVMISFPVKAYLGKLSSGWIWHACFVSIISLVLSLLFWEFSTRRYTSVSS